MTQDESEAWSSFVEVIVDFLGNNKSSNYKEIVAKMVQNYKKKLTTVFSSSLHFLYSHIVYFPENLGVVSKEQGERFHQDIKDMKRRYQGSWDIRMMAVYCWSLGAGTQSQKNHKKKTTKRSFQGKRERFQ